MQKCLKLEFMKELKPLRNTYVIDNHRYVPYVEIFNDFSPDIGKKSNTTAQLVKKALSTLPKRLGSQPAICFV
jgi:hypothetical protein